MKPCPNCKINIEDDKLQCPYCNTRLDGEEIPDWEVSEELDLSLPSLSSIPPPPPATRAPHVPARSPMSASGSKQHIPYWRKFSFWAFRVVPALLFASALFQYAKGCGCGEDTAESNSNSAIDVAAAYLNAELEHEPVDKYLCAPNGIGTKFKQLTKYQFISGYKEKVPPGLIDKATQAPPLPRWFAYLFRTYGLNSYGVELGPDNYYVYVKRFPGGEFKVFGLVAEVEATIWEQTSRVFQTEGDPCAFPPALKVPKPRLKPETTSRRKRKAQKNEPQRFDPPKPDHEEFPSVNEVPIEPISPEPSETEETDVVETRSTSEDNPYMVIAASVKQSISDGRERAEKKAEELRAAGFESAGVHNGRDFPNFKCCFWVVIVDAFETSEQAAELRDEVKNAGFECYVKER